MSISSEHTQCQATKQDGSPCLARPAPGETLCTFHDPKRAEERAAGRSKGGESRSRPRVVVPGDQPDLGLNDIGDVCVLLGNTINQVRKGTLDVKVASTVGYLASILIRAIEGGELEKRLAILETALRHQSDGGSGAFHRPVPTVEETP